MNKETIAYIALGTIMSIFGVIARNKINQNDVTKFINDAEGASRTLRTVVKPFIVEEPQVPQQ